MGVDWARASLPPNADIGLLLDLVERQAVAFQSVWGWTSHACSDLDPVGHALRKRLHFAAYRAASDSLSGLLVFPEWDDARNCSSDDPELSPYWRVHPITYNPIYPPLWRLQAYRTWLPDPLRRQVRQWKQWAEQAARGEHDDYLRDLHLYETSDKMHYHWSYLRGNATASLGEGGDWASRQSLAEVRDGILRLPEPTIFNARIDPTDEGSDGPDRLDARRQGLFDDLAVVIDLTRAWNATVPEPWKVPDYAGDYHRTLDAFKEMARDPWLLDFLQWAEACAERGFALYLDS